MPDISFNIFNSNVSFNPGGSNITFNTIPPVSAPPSSGPLDIRINFRATSASVSGYNTLFGSPHSSVISTSSLSDISGSSTGVGITSISTGSWAAFSSLTSNDSVSGITGGNYLTGATTGVYQSIWFNYGTSQPARYDSTRPQLRISGLDPIKTYQIKMCGGDGDLSFGCKINYYISGSSTSSTTTINGDITNVTTGSTFTMSPKGDGTIDLWVNSSNTGDLGVICGLTILEV